MADKNLLTIILPGDENNHLLVKFLESLPKGTRKRLDSRGYIGNLRNNIYSFKKSNMRHFVIFSSPDFSGLRTDYFYSNQKASVAEIPDRLMLWVDYKQQDNYECHGAREMVPYQGSIDDMVERYNRLSSTDSKELLVNHLQSSEFLRRNVTEKSWFKRGVTKLLPTYVSVGLETADGKYLLKCTGARGPYSGIL